MSNNDNNQFGLTNKYAISNMNKYTTYFMISLLVIGLVLTYVSWDIDSKLQQLNCTSSSLKTANKIVLCIGIILITSSLSFYTCSKSCDNTFVGFRYSYYVAFMILLSITLIILGSFISSESSKENCENTGHPVFIWGLGVLILLPSSYYLYDTFKPKF